MGQVSGALSLDMTRVEHAVAQATVTELVRMERRSNEATTPLEDLAEAVTAHVVAEIGPALASVHAKLDELLALTVAEAQRRDRIRVRPDMANGEFRTIRDEHGQVVAELDPAALAARGQGPAWAPEERVYPRDETEQVAG